MSIVTTTKPPALSTARSFDTVKLSRSAQAAFDIFAKCVDFQPENKEAILRDVKTIASSKLGKDFLVSLSCSMARTGISLNISMVDYDKQMGAMVGKKDKGTLIYTKSCSQFGYYSKEGQHIHLNRYTNDQLLFHELVHFNDFLLGKLGDLGEHKSTNPLDSNWAEESAIYGTHGGRFSENAYLREIGRVERIWHLGVDIHRSPDETRLFELFERNAADLPDYLKMERYSRLMTRDFCVRLASHVNSCQILAERGYVLSEDQALEALYNLCKDGQEFDSEKIRNILQTPLFSAILDQAHEDDLLDISKYANSYQVSQYLLELPYLNRKKVENTLRDSIELYFEHGHLKDFRKLTRFIPGVKALLQDPCEHAWIVQFAIEDPSHLKLKQFIDTFEPNAELVAEVITRYLATNSCEGEKQHYLDWALMHLGEREKLLEALRSGNREQISRDLENPYFRNAIDDHLFMKLIPDVELLLICLNSGVTPSESIFEELFDNEQTVTVDTLSQIVSSKGLEPLRHRRFTRLWTRAALRFDDPRIANQILALPFLDLSQVDEEVSDFIDEFARWSARDCERFLQVDYVKDLLVQTQHDPNFLSFVLESSNHDFIGVYLNLVKPNELRVITEIQLILALEQVDRRQELFLENLLAQLTVETVTCDTGWGNSLELRTSEDWDKPIPLKNVGPDKWEINIPNTAREFKLVKRFADGSIEWEKGLNRIHSLKNPPHFTR
ncbi:MAG: M91 family zinc metallopeptidase [Simkaniaceae bacterium]|nr:M91 family zinc metallopeptidase [Simkaniaceae bacterium]